LAFVRFILFGADTANDFMDRNCLYLASAISFYTLFSIFPLMLATISAVGYVIGPWAQQDQLDLARDIAAVIPVSTEFVRSTVEDIVSARAITGIASVLLMLVAATAVFSAIRKGVNEAWGIRESRPFLKERLMDFGLVLGAGLVLLTVLFLAPVLGLLESITDYLEPDGWYFSRLFWGLASLLVSPALAFATFLALYRLLPNTEVRVRDVWLGALGASLAFHAVTAVFVWYVQTFPIHNAVHGPIGGLVALLAWVYLSAIIVLLGALITSRYAAYVSKSPTRELRHLWTGFSRVRLRVVASTAVQ
jgi:membrane protein